MIDIEMFVSCDFPDCKENQSTDDFYMSGEDFIDKVCRMGWGFPSNIDENLADDIIYCRAHLNLTQTEQKNEPKDWHVVNKRLVCSEHKIPECDMHELSELL